MSKENPMTTFKLAVRIGEHAFRAEGPEEIVRAEYQRFLETISPQAPAHLFEANATEAKQPTQPNTVAATAGMLSQLNCTVGPLALNPEKGTVSLWQLPETKDYVLDSLLLLLWGFDHLAGTRHVPDPNKAGFLDRPDTSVTAAILTGAARKSGIVVERIDRVVTTNRDLITRLGAKRGTRYRLTKAGKERAEKLLGEMGG
jgi:hypothetical protein